MRMDINVTAAPSVTPATPVAPPSDVYLFGTCVLDIFMPEAGVDAITGKATSRQRVRERGMEGILGGGRRASSQDTGGTIPKAL